LFHLNRGCRIFLGTTTYIGTKMGKKYSKWPRIIPNGHKIYQMKVKYVCRPKGIKMYQHFSPQEPPKVTQIWLFVWIYTIWQPWLKPFFRFFSDQKCRFRSRISSSWTTRSAIRYVHWFWGNAVAVH
jgi:hypothetical protein